VIVNLVIAGVVAVREARAAGLGGARQQGG
jgi:hypothetical protein